MDLSEILEVIKDILSKYLTVYETKSLSGETLIKDLELDSLDRAEVVMNIEKDIEMTIPDEELYEGKWLVTPLREIAERIKELKGK